MNVLPKSGIIKYNVKIACKVSGSIEKSDMTGAIYGQTEGLLGPEMDLNELQRISKMGRMKISIESTANTTSGEIVIPMNTDIDTCALIAASIESIKMVGPYDCTFKLVDIDDARALKKVDIVKRAKEIKRMWGIKASNENESMLDDAYANVVQKISTYGSSKLTQNTELNNPDLLILVGEVKNVINMLLDNIMTQGSSPKKSKVTKKVKVSQKVSDSKGKQAQRDKKGKTAQVVKKVKVSQKVSDSKGKQAQRDKKGKTAQVVKKVKVSQKVSDSKGKQAQRDKKGKTAQVVKKVKVSQKVPDSKGKQAQRDKKGKTAQVVKKVKVSKSKK